MSTSKITLSAIKNISNQALFVSILISTVFYSIDLPYLGREGFLTLLLIFASLLIVLNLEQVKTAVRYHRYSLVFLLLLYAWMWVSAYFSDFQSTAINHSMKYSIYVLIFFSFLILTYKKRDRLSYYRLALVFFIVLAIFGIIEYFYPHFKLFYALRSPISLNVYPRISSVMQWPNQFGILMSIGFVLSHILFSKKSISISLFYISSIIFIFVVTLSASTNAWLMVFAGAFIALLYKSIRIVYFVLLLGLLIFFILFFPVSVNKLGLSESSIFPLMKYSYKQSEGKTQVNSMIINNSFEEFKDDYSRSWDINESDDTIQRLNNDAIDGRFSVRLVTKSSADSLVQNMNHNKWMSLYHQYTTITVKAWAKTTSTNVMLCLRDIVCSHLHPGNGNWHELELKTKISKLPRNRLIKVKLVVNETYSESLFDNVTIHLEATNNNIHTEIKTDEDIHLNKSNSNVKENIDFFLESGYRFKIWNTAISQIIANPFSGSGIQTFPIVSEKAGAANLHTHNILINILFDMGIIGLFLSIVFIYFILKKADWNNPLVIIPVVLVFSGQMVDYFLHDFTYTTVLLYFLAEAGNSQSKSNIDK